LAFVPDGCNNKSIFTKAEEDEEMKKWIGRIFYFIIINLIFIIGGPLAILWDTLEGAFWGGWEVARDDTLSIWDLWKQAIRNTKEIGI
jgi:hypothetical protein